MLRPGGRFRVSYLVWTRATPRHPREYRRVGRCIAGARAWRTTDGRARRFVDVAGEYTDTAQASSALTHATKAGVNSLFDALGLFMEWANSDAVLARDVRGRRARGVARRRHFDFVLLADTLSLHEDPRR